MNAEGIVRFSGIVAKTNAAKVALGVLGFALLIAGAVSELATRGNGGAEVLVIAGALLGISPFVIHRLEKVSLSQQGFEFAFSREVSELGAPNTAMTLDRTHLSAYAGSYALVHSKLAGDSYRSARVLLQDHLVHEAMEVASNEQLEAGEVRNLFQNGTPVVRVLVIGLMRGNLQLADGATLLSAITKPQSQNEQYQALILTGECWDYLPASARRDIHSALSALPVPRGGARAQLIKPLLDRQLDSQ